MVLPISLQEIRKFKEWAWVSRQAFICPMLNTVEWWSSRYAHCSCHQTYLQPAMWRKSQCSFHSWTECPPYMWDYTVFCWGPDSLGQSSKPRLGNGGIRSIEGLWERDNKAWGMQQNYDCFQARSPGNKINCQRNSAMPVSSYWFG